MDNFAAQNIEEPIDLVKLCLNTHIKVKLRHGRELKGVLHVFLSLYQFINSRKGFRYTFQLPSG